MKNFDRRDRIFTRTEGSDNYVKYFIRYTSRKIISQCQRRDLSRTTFKPKKEENVQFILSSIISDED